MDLVVHPGQTALVRHEFTHGRFDIRRPHHEQPSTAVRLTVGHARLLPDFRIDLDDHTVNRRQYISQVVFAFQAPANFALIQFFAHQR